MSLVFRDTNLFTAAASVCGVTLEPARSTPPSVCAPTDRTPPPVCGPPRPPTGPPLRSVGLRWALKPRTRPVHYKMTLLFLPSAFRDAFFLSVQIHIRAAQTER